MAESSLPAPVEGLPPWPGILRQPRRAMRGAADQRSWKGPLLLMLAVPVAVWALWASTQAPPPKHPPLTGHPLGDIALTWGVFGLSTFLFDFGLGRLIGGRATLAEVFIVALWGQIPALVVRLPLDGLGLGLHGSEWWSMPGIEKPTALLALPAGAIALKSIDVIAGFWGLVLGVVGLSEVHRLSVWRILLVIFLPVFLLGVFSATLIALLVVRASGAGG